jgi:DCN1-like protein 1/2
MQLCEELGIDPEADVVLFCLAADLGSKATGEWEKDPFVKGWLSIDSG